jgi:protein-S-isoprenylcysteine O-methyltransferase Ste14
MTKLSNKAVIGLARTIGILAVAIFVPAWTLEYWQGWIYLVIFGGSATAVTYFLSQSNPELVERRLNAGYNDEKDEKQRAIQQKLLILFFGCIVVCSFDPWSGDIPNLLVAIGEVLVLAGFGIVYAVLKANPFAGSTIEVVPDQKVIHDGPYSIVRHPMYAGAILIFAGTPLALSSWFGILFVPFLVKTLMDRVVEEEKTLHASLPGYEEYTQAIKDRMVPSVW